MFLIQYCYRKTCELSLEMFLIKCMVHIYMTFSQITIFFPSKNLKLRDCKLFSTQVFQWCFRKNQSSQRKNSSTVEKLFLYPQEISHLREDYFIRRKFARLTIKYFEEVPLSGDVKPKDKSLIT